MSDNSTFKIGLCMAGAVSAGAYTAGVMDYLLEALEEWEKRRGQEGVPSHRVSIDVIGGASAGGMTGIIAASMLNNPFNPVRKLEGGLMQEQKENKLYHTWVDLLKIDMFPELLDTSDIKNGRVFSLLNSNFITELSKKALEVDKNQWVDRPYINQQLKFFTTLTNIEGFKYSTELRGNLTINDYLLSRHNDYATFILNTSESQYKDDGWIPVDFKQDHNVEIARNAAMATGAFPVGLRSRAIERNKKYLNDQAWFKDVTEKIPITNNPHRALIVDGGIINNEPFEKVKSLLTNVSDDHNDFGSTVLMIDPFPSQAEQFDVANDGLANVIGGTLSAMLGHLRTKPEVLMENMKDDNYSQFQIAPRRAVNGQIREGSGAIACGFLGGFGGFIHKEFRIHDFFLGRANCERFLREHFTVPIDTRNSIFSDGYNGVSADAHVSSDKQSRQIIPLFKPEGEMYLPTFESKSDWPVRKEKDIDRFKGDLKKRAGKIVMNAADFNWKQRILMGIGNYVVLRGKLADAVLDAIKESMKKHELLKG